MTAKRAMEAAAPPPRVPGSKEGSRSSREGSHDGGVALPPIAPQRSSSGRASEFSLRFS